MTLATLIRKRDTGKSANANPAKAANDWPVKSASLARIATLALANPPDVVRDPPDTAAEARRQRVLAMLAANPEARYAVLTDSESDPMAVIVVVAIRGCASCELCIPPDKYDGLILLDLIERHGGTVH